LEKAYGFLSITGGWIKKPGLYGFGDFHPGWVFIFGPGEDEFDQEGDHRNAQAHERQANDHREFTEQNWITVSIPLLGIFPLGFFGIKILKELL
jgi:hypothetical protein